MNNREKQEHLRYAHARTHLLEAMTQFRAKVLDITPIQHTKWMEKFLELVYLRILNTAVSADYMPTIESIRLEIEGIVNETFPSK